MTRYTIAVENPERRCSGVVMVELDGLATDPEAIPLVDDGAVHQVRVVLGGGGRPSSMAGAGPQEGGALR